MISNKLTENSFLTSCVALLFLTLLINLSPFSSAFAGELFITAFFFCDIILNFLSNNPLARPLYLKKAAGKRGFWGGSENGNAFVHFAYVIHFYAR